MLVPGPRRPAALSFPWFALAASVAIRRHGRGRLVTQGAIVPLQRRRGLRALLSHGFSRSGANRAGGGTRSRTASTSGWTGAMTLAAERWVYGRAGRGGGRRLPRACERVAALLSTARAERARDPQRGGPRRVPPGSRGRARLREQLGVAGCAASGLRGRGLGAQGPRPRARGVAQSPPWQLLVVGDGDRAGFNARPRARPRGSGAFRRPPVARLRRYLAAGDAFVFRRRTSRSGS